MRRQTIAACALLALVAACGNGSEAIERTTPAKAIANLPTQVLGLKVVEENVTTDIKGVSRTYVDSLGLFSFRENDNLLRATIQIGRFTNAPETRKEKFRDAIVAQLGSTTPSQIRVGKTTTYMTTGSEQSIFSWFDNKGFYVMSVRSDYPFPRTLLRKLVEAKLLG